MRFGVLIALMALAGCTKTVAEMSYSEQQELAAKIVQRCIAQGVQSGTPEMEACTGVEARREVATRERQARREDARHARAGGTMCQNFGGNVVCF